MKNATKHAETLKTFAKKLKKHSSTAPEFADPVRAFVFGVFAYDATDANVTNAMKVVDKEFVDLNELRVATELEVIQMVGPRYPLIAERADMISLALNAIFEKEQTLSLLRVKELGKREARQMLRDLPGVTPFVEAFTLLFGMDGNALPVDEQTVALLRAEKCIDEESDAAEVQRFCEHHLKADEFQDVYLGLREKFATGAPKPKAAKAAKKTTKKK